MIYSFLKIVNHNKKGVQWKWFRAFRSYFTILLSLGSIPMCVTYITCDQVFTLNDALYVYRISLILWLSTKLLIDALLLFQTKLFGELDRAHRVQILK